MHGRRPEEVAEARRYKQPVFTGDTVNEVIDQDAWWVGTFDSD